MLPEPRAISVAAFIASLALAIMLWHVSRPARHARAAAEWAWGSILLTAGALVNVAQNDLPPLFSQILATPAMMAGVAMIILGIRRVQAQPRNPVWLAIPVVLMLVAAYGWGYAAPNLTMRVITFSLLMSAMMATLCRSVGVWHTGKLHVAAWFIGVPAFVVTSTLMVRTLLAAKFGAEPIASGGGPMTTITYLVGSTSFVAIQIGLILLHQLLLLEDLHRSAERDAMTGLLNRRGFTESLPPQLDGYAMLTMDIDFFKKINDEFGHAAGDDILAMLGNSLRRLLREGDLAVRLGGEEFGLLLKNADQQIALQVADRIRWDISSQSSAMVGGPVTVSLGLAVAVPNESIDSLAHRADLGLYLAKANGKNRCEWSTEPLVASTLGLGTELQ